MAKSSHPVTREQVVQAAKALGLDPENLVSINITRDKVRVIEYIRDENGNRIPNHVLNNYDRHSYSIIIAD